MACGFPKRENNGADSASGDDDDGRSMTFMTSMAIIAKLRSKPSTHKDKTAYSGFDQNRVFTALDGAGSNNATSVTLEVPQNTLPSFGHSWDTSNTDCNQSQWRQTTRNMKGGIKERCKQEGPRTHTRSHVTVFCASKSSQDV